MDWIILTPQDLECALNKPQLDILKAEAIRSLNRDISQDIISGIVARIRAEVAASGLNILDTDHSRIPAELKDCAIRLAIEALQLRIPSMEISDAQSRQADIARETLLRVASGELPVSRPVFGVRSSTKRKGVSSGAAKRMADRKSMEGI